MKTLKKKYRIMQCPLAVSILFVMLPLGSHAAELKLESAVRQVTVYPGMAAVTREGTVVLKTGSNTVIVSPDVGGVVRARALAKLLDDSDLAIIDKRRPKANEAQVMNIIGDVKDKTCIIVDDIVDTAGTLCKAAVALKENGASKVVAYCTHAVLSGSAIENISGSELDQLIVTDTIPLSSAAKKCDRIHQLSISALLAESLRRVCNAESISALFE